ncbi:3'(2'),5'-bisphosphate nucleotidase CysQ [Sphingomonas astaxanthinifaciens]|uniref:3'(2'),5'-bisphosphate nucleotidase CysQ n=1 Tax=Sphingomonas astaxanthinifaciens DSM 22298 TaxID=1123267 RepID=A0ABQ5Z7L4_9SPHN|nr:3'(2'),5'-bisphosphate nucleotidase CysQ [Sphingomonas astaxanthinifaciens]GLR47431.1 3'(2'),5'-bisphosphate nucleotidase CysQ [Sphingomonas astaxanthinifaciens DSM 22298]
MDRAALIDALIPACLQAGAVIRAIRARGCGHELKSDSSPVTEADHAAEAILIAALAEAAPGIPVVAEEEVAAGRCPDLGDLFFLVDPLDGTKEFVRGGDDYTVNVGLVTREGPVLGLVYAPEQDRLYAGAADGEAFVLAEGERVPLRVAEPRRPLVVVASKSHFNAATEDYLAAAAPGAQRVSVGSSLKFCIVAAGEADFYPRLSPTCEWDTAAGHAVLLAAGGRVDGPDGAPLAYGKPAFLNPGFAATSGWSAPPVGPALG